MSADRREFVDSNVLVYAHDRSAKTKYQAAAALVSSLWDSRAGCVSIQVLQEFFVTVTRKIPKPMAVEEAEERVRELARWKLHSPNAGDVLGAIETHRRHRLAFWDAMIIESASRLACEVVWSEDLQDGLRLKGVEVRNPFREDRNDLP